jgi:hypothetical protein
MKPLTSTTSLILAGLWGAVLPITAQVNVTQEHNHLSRDGLYINSAFTRSAAANVRRDLNFNGTISGNVYAQPLYIEGGPSGRARVIVVTESNNVYAIDAITGTVIWQRNVGPPVTSGLPCGNISPLGITGTPVVHLASRSLFFDAMHRCSRSDLLRRQQQSLRFCRSVSDPHAPTARGRRRTPESRLRMGSENTETARAVWTLVAQVK